MSRKARSVSLTRYGTIAPEHLQSFVRGVRATLLYILKALPDSLKSIRLRGNIQQALIGFGILHNRFRLSIDGKHQRSLGLLKLFHEFPRIAPECRHRLYIFLDVEHKALTLSS
jgi:hypothetical protein